MNSGSAHASDRASATTLDTGCMGAVVDDLVRRAATLQGATPEAA